MEGRVQAGFSTLFGVCEAAQWRGSPLTDDCVCWLVALHVNDGEEQARQLSFFAPRPSGKHVLLLGSQPPRKYGGPVPAGRPQDLKAEIASLSHLHQGGHPSLSSPCEARGLELGIPGLLGQQPRGPASSSVKW